jgi:hypothetical protein
VFEEEAYRTHFGGAEGNDAFPWELLLLLLLLLLLGSGSVP